MVATYAGLNVKGHPNDAHVVNLYNLFNINTIVY